MARWPEGRRAPVRDGDPEGQGACDEHERGRERGAAERDHRLNARTTEHRGHPSDRIDTS
jgi:hypothetical protein